MAGVPSIVMGLFIYVFWVVPRGIDGLNGLSGALALACLMLPIVVRSSEEMLRSCRSTCATPATRSAPARAARR